MEFGFGVCEVGIVRGIVGIFVVSIDRVGVGCNLLFDDNLLVLVVGEG